ncbi:hypothetical protein [Staphylococcus phage Stab22]|nr:hypothetical protein CF7_0061 [Staphylococcus phage CF7]VEV89402.1 hypothetical protein [Staphylococcus phage Stab22]
MNTGEIRFNRSLDEWIITSMYQDELGEMNIVITFYNKEENKHGSMVLPTESSTGEVEKELESIEEEYPLALPLNSISVNI